MRWTLHTRRRFGMAAIAFAATLACTPPAFAWGPLGHRIVARLAEAQLTPQARAEAQALLALRGARHLSDIAVWADDLRDTDPALFQHTKRLHFVNFHSRDCAYDPPRDCRNGECVVAAIDQYSAILANRANPPEERAEALAFVVHFVADIHQPLHADYRHDAGGNDFQVRWWNRGTNLHRVWDSLMLDSTHLSAARFADQLAAQPARIATGGTPAQWAEESCRIDRDDGVYPRSRFIDDAYVQRELPIAEQRLRQAGARLAELLNRDLANG
ncbi:MAG: Endonuclease [Rhodanobacteraceae bacterium]|nr:MAG: Endonuclease [Rhodanobacteraceae bacterium]